MSAPVKAWAIKGPFGIVVEVTVTPGAPNDAQPLNILTRDFPEDFAQENGNYECLCRDCGTTFRGHKRRVFCRVCNKPKPSTHHIDLDALEREAVKELQIADCWQAAELLPAIFAKHREGK